MAAWSGTENGKRTILVVEDDEEINRLIGAYVEYAGFRYLPAFDGAQALAQIRDHIPCAVILDLMLPDVSGWDVCRQLKTDRGTFDIPIIILTALDHDASREEGIRCGAAEYLTKPFNPDELLQALHKHAGQPSAAPR
jgi:DNA-binding response OmpR family regulator